MFSSPKYFPIENRPELGSVDIQSVNSYLETKEYEGLIKNFHFLLFLKGLHLLESDDFHLICKIINGEEKSSSLLSRTSWKTFLTILAESFNSPQMPSSSKANATWSCKHCTFMNTGLDCEMCGLPRE